MIEIPTDAGAWSILFTVHDPISGEACDADSLPTVVFRYTDGAASGVSPEVNGTVVNVGTGLYELQVDMSSGGPVQVQHAITPVITAVVGGVTQKAPLEPFRAVPQFWYGSVVADGANTATTFKVAGSFYDATDALKECLLVFVDGTVRTQMRPVTAYDATTDFVTVGAGGFSLAPSGGEQFLLISR